jgi:tyrosyl-tRNA synthetase
MSKSDPESAIFMEDTEADVKTKIKKAYCPVGIVAGNPIMDYVKNIIFGAKDSFTIQRKKENGGDL